MLPIVVTLDADLLLELKVIYSEGLNTLSESVNNVSKLLGSELGVGLRS